MNRRSVPVAKIEHFAVYAADPVALKDFYVQALGLHVIVENPGDPPAFFLADDHGMAIEVLGRPPGTPETNQRWVCHLAFWFEDFEAVKRSLEQRGIVFETETLVNTGDMRTAFFRDPGGNRCQIVWRRRVLGH
jgi:glyoxylase I family protein